MDYTNASKYIALILRHKPEAIGISLDEHGWADANELVEGVRRKFPGFSFVDLKKIVIADDKQRYTFDESETRIRARQGHSVKVDVGLKEIIPPNILYHGTATRFLGSIKKVGLLPQSRLYVHLSKDYDTAVKVGQRHGEPVVLKINAKQMQKDGFIFFISENGVYLVKSVPASYIIC